MQFKRAMMNILSWKQFLLNGQDCIRFSLSLLSHFRPSTFFSFHDFPSPSFHSFRSIQSFSFIQFTRIKVAWKMFISAFLWTESLSHVFDVQSSMISFPFNITFSFLLLLFLSLSLSWSDFNHFLSQWLVWRWWWQSDEAVWSSRSTLSRDKMKNGSLVLRLILSSHSHSSSLPLLSNTQVLAPWHIPCFCFLLIVPKVFLLLS